MAAPADLLFWVITLVSAFFSLGIVVAIIFFAVRYRRGAKVDRSNPPQYNHIVEVIWTGGPLVIALGIFVWGTVLFFEFRRMPANAMDVYVVGKQWMWKLQHPEGRWEMNELHVPIGRPVRLTMTSEDVIHSFFIPAFRVKTDVIPGQYTQMWFTPTKPGTYHLFCAEFCGTLHSQMTGTVTVMEQADFEQWLATGAAPGGAAALGAKLFTGRGCNGCHGPDASVRAPNLEGIFGRPIPVQIPPPGVPVDKVQWATVPARTIVADQRYIHDSIVLPEQEVAAGFKPIMPTYKGQLTEEEIFALTAYIRSLGQKRDTDREAGVGRRTQSLTQEDYEARTGFVPKNIKTLTGAGAGGAPSGRTRTPYGTVDGIGNPGNERRAR